MISKDVRAAEVEIDKRIRFLIWNSEKGAFYARLAPIQTFYRPHPNFLVARAGGPPLLCSTRPVRELLPRL